MVGLGFGRMEKSCYGPCEQELRTLQHSIAGNFGVVGMVKVVEQRLLLWDIESHFMYKLLLFH